MTTSATTTYRIGRHCSTGDGGFSTFGAPVLSPMPIGSPRPLIRESDDAIIGIVDSDVGGATIGSMSLADIRSRFGADVAAACRRAE